MRKARAMVGGQIGINGEFYKGGTFLPGTERSKGLAKRGRVSRKALIEPGVWVEAVQGQRPIYQRIQTFVRIVERAAVVQFADDHPSMTYYFKDAQELHALVSAYNRGDRF